MQNSFIVVIDNDETIQDPIDLKKSISAISGIPMDKITVMGLIGYDFSEGKEVNIDVIWSKNDKTDYI